MLIKHIARTFISVTIWVTLLGHQAQAQVLPNAVNIDFSYAGYQASPWGPKQVATVLLAKPTGKDDTRLLQGAINRFAKLPLQTNGFRGALMLLPGNYRISGQLRITASGIAIKGNKQAKITAIGTDRCALIEIGTKAQATNGQITSIIGDVKAGSLQLPLRSTTGLHSGDQISIRRPSTKEWIAALGMDTIKGVFADLRGLQWRPGTRDLVWHRIITAVNTTTHTITIDAPVTSALQKQYGGALVTKLVNSTSINHIMIDGVTLISQFSNSRPKDEEHAWTGVAVNNAEDVYLSGITAKHFVGSAFLVQQNSRKITIDSCSALTPVSETGGYRRRNFYIEGQQVLVKNCFSEDGMADFVVGLCAAGPNVFLNCIAKNSHGASGAIESWSSGTLFENVTIANAGLFLGYDMQRVQAAGWTAVNSVVWNCKADYTMANGPVLAPNLVSTSTISLYQTQLKARNVEQPDAKNHAAIKSPVLFTEKNLPRATTTQAVSKPFSIVNGRFVNVGRVIWGGEINESWWLGHIIPSIALDAGVSITRFIPGKTGRGLTEELPDMINKMQTGGMPFYQGGPGLWYDRRRDEHSVTERMDGNVWAAFYEFPWARSGEGKAWDGLSKFDVSRYNPWYFSRIKNFLTLIDQAGLVYYHSLYNTHNVLEIGAHWADFPWRPANNVNDTGLPEPPPLEPNNRLHLGNQFYSISHTGIKKLHEAYINHVLDELASAKNIVFNLGYQFPGPLEFQKFFLRTVAAWEKRNHKTVRLELGTSKDITDSILNSPEFNHMINVVDMRYWQYKPDGTLWAPPSGQNLAFRELNGKLLGKGVDTPPATTPQLAYKQVREYRDKYPDKVFIAWHNGVGQLPALMAGAAQVYLQNPAAGQSQGRVADTTDFDTFVHRYLSSNLMYMTPVDSVLKDVENNWCLSDSKGKHILIYSLSGVGINFEHALTRSMYKAIWYNPISKKTLRVNSLNTTLLRIIKPDDGQWVLYLTKS